MITIWLEKNEISFIKNYTVRKLNWNKPFNHQKYVFYLLLGNLKSELKCRFQNPTHDKNHQIL